MTDDGRSDDLPVPIFSVHQTVLDLRLDYLSRFHPSQANIVIVLALVVAKFFPQGSDIP